MLLKFDIITQADTEQMAKKADAWREYKEAAMIDMMLQTLPKVLDKKCTEELEVLREKNFHIGQTCGNL